MTKFTMTLTFDTYQTKMPSSDWQSGGMAQEIIDRLQKYENDGIAFENVAVENVEEVLDENQKRMNSTMEDAFRDQKFSAYLHQNDFQYFENFHAALLFCYDNTVTTKEGDFIKHRLDNGEKFAILEYQGRYAVVKDFFINSEQFINGKIIAYVDENKILERVG